MGKYFFEEKDGTVTLTSACEINMVYFFLPQLQLLYLNSLSFQQNGPTAHVARDSMNILRKEFPILNLNNYDLFLWGY